MASRLRSKTMHASVEAVPLMRSENKTTEVFRKRITFDMAGPKVATISIQERSPVIGSIGFVDACVLIKMLD